MCRSSYLRWVKRLEESLPEGAIDFSGSAVPPPREAMLRLLKDRTLANEFLPDAVRTEWGHPGLFDALHECYGMRKEQTVIVGGASLALFTICRTFLQPGDVAVVEWPTYDPFEDVCTSVGAKTVPFRREPESFGLEPEHLDRLLASNPGAKLVLISNPHNPSGSFGSADIIGSLASIAERYGCLLVVDEVFRDLGPSEDLSRCPRPAAVLGNHVISLSGLSKAYGLSALRCGWIFSTTQLAEEIRKCHVTIENIGSRITQVIAADFLKEASSQRHANMVQLGKNWDAAADIFAGMPRALASCLNVGSEVDGRASTIFFPKVPRGDTKAFVESLEAEKVFVTPGSFFGAPDRVRIGIGSFDANSEPILRTGLKIIRDTFERMETAG